MPEKTSQQVSFGGGLNAQTAPHVLAEGEVQLSTNVDFALEWGALVCKRGSVLLGSAGSTPVELVLRNYNGTQATLDTSPWYVVGNGTGGFWRGTGTVTFTQLFAGDGAAVGPAVGVVYQSYAYLANGSAAYRDDGTNAYTWVLPQPPQPFVVIGTGGGGYPFAISNGTTIIYPNTDPASFNGSWTAGAVGSFVSAGGTPILSTLTNGTLGTATDSGIIAIATVTGSRIYVNIGTALATETLFNTNFNQNVIDLVPNMPSLEWGTTPRNITRTIGNYGVDYLPIGFSNPNAVVAISVDYSIFDTGFFNYWHAQTTIGEIQSAVPDTVTQLLSQQGNLSYAEYLASLVALAPPAKFPTSGVGNSINSHPKRGISLVQNLPSGIMTWAVPRTNYQLIGTYNFGLGATGWEDIAAVRVSIQTTDDTAMVVGTPVTYGNSQLCLSDTSNGLSWFQTIAHVDAQGNILAESIPSLPSEATGTATDTKGVLFQYGGATLNTQFISGTATNGATHRIIYRQGGFLSDAYMVDMVPLSNGTIFQDTYYPDVQVVANSTMTRSLWDAWPVGGVGAATIFQDRVFLGTGNSLFWSTPGNPSQIESDSDVTVSVSGDPIQALLTWDRLIVINNNSVYEMDGSVWEGPNQDWVLRKTGSRRGAAASKTTIRTPDGVLLFDYDGVSLYYPGYGIDTPLDWVYEKIGDFWRGTSSNSPAAQKGRIPALNHQGIAQSCAVYADHKIYLATPTGTNSTAGCDTIWVLDMSKKTVWMYQPQGYTVDSLYWDYAGGRLVAGDHAGGVVQFETGQTDLSSPISWSARTRAWSTKQPLIIENLAVEAQVGTGSIKVEAVVDNTSTVTLGTYTSAVKQWYTTPLLGSVCNNLAFNFDGTQSGSGMEQAVYQVSWDCLPQPAPVQYYREDYDNGGSEQEKIWESHFVEMAVNGTGTVTAVTFVDNVATMVSYIPGPTTVSTFPFPYPYEPAFGPLAGNGPQLIPQAFPAEIYGNIAYTTYTVGTFSNVTFQVYNDYYRARPEPARLGTYVTPHVPLPSETYIKTWLAQINPEGGVVTGRLLVDGVVVSTQTMTGSLRHTYEFGLPNITTGKEVYVIYTGTTPFKYYEQGLASYEFEPKPFAKTTWLVTYKKLGGVTQLDMARFFAMDIEGPTGALLTNTWIIDGTVFSTNTFTLTGLNAGEASNVARIYNDQIPFPTGARGYLFQQQITSTQPFKVWRSNIDIERVGVKGLSRVTLNGTPSGSTNA